MRGSQRGFDTTTTHSTCFRSVVLALVLAGSVRDSDASAVGVNSRAIGLLAGRLSRVHVYLHLLLIGNRLGRILIHFKMFNFYSNLVQILNYYNRA